MRCIKEALSTVQMRLSHEADQTSHTLWYFLKAARQSPNRPHFSQPSPTLTSWNFLLMAQYKHPLSYSKPSLRMSTSRQKNPKIQEKKKTTTRPYNDFCKITKSYKLFHLLMPDNMFAHKYQCNKSFFYYY